MGKVTGFLEIDRQERRYETASDRIRHFREFVISLSEEATRDQAARCMNCGIPYCHNGCPVNNQIPDWNDLVYRGDWHTAHLNLHSTNNFPEFTGRVCPAPCEASCTLNLNDVPVTIKTIECAIVDRAWQEGWIVPERAPERTGKSVAVIGSGPAGLACAQQLARVGHDVHVFEKHAKAGGLLRYGIPDFKLEKHHVDRRVAQMQDEGVTFHYGAHVGVNTPAREIVDRFDAVVLTGGAEQPRELPMSGRELAGIHFAMEFLPQQNRRVSNEPLGDSPPIRATGKHVVVIGGGDTGSDCIGTSNRHGAASITQFEILPQPPVKENKMLVWPDWPLKLRTSSSHQEGCDRDWSVQTRRAIGDLNDGKGGRITALECVRVDWQLGDGGQMKLVEVPGSEFTLKADLVLLAMGFTGPRKQGLVEQAGVDLDARGNVKAPLTNYKTSKAKVFACGDMRRGQSLVVWAIREGRQCARGVDEFLMGSSELPR